MENIRDRAETDAQMEFLKYANKDYEFIMERYVEHTNRVTTLMTKYNISHELSDNELYDYAYSSYLENVMRIALCDKFLTQQGYEKDSKELWRKKKKGFFR